MAARAAFAPRLGPLAVLAGPAKEPVRPVIDAEFGISDFACCAGVVRAR